MYMNFMWGFYIQGQCCVISADFNADVKYYAELKKLLYVKKVKDFDLIRIGPRNDGGYVMLNDFNGAPIAYSFGISNDVGWDTVMAKHGYQIYMYDHTIDSLPCTRDEFKFFKEGIAGIDSETHPLKTLEYYMKRNEHTKEKSMILKMDVEGAEWDFLESVDSKVLAQFDQIIFELHDLVQTKDSDRILSLLKKINKTHDVVHVHGNNTGYLLTIGETVFPDALEVTYVNKKKYETVLNDDIVLPNSLDGACDPVRSDVNLGLWNQPLKIN